MQGILKVTPEKLIAAADEFNTCGGQVRNLTRQMLQIVDGLRGCWEGQAATTYNTKFHRLEDDMDRMYRMISEHVRDLNTMARQYQSAERANVATGNSLAGDVIS